MRSAEKRLAGLDPHPIGRASELAGTLLVLGYARGPSQFVQNPAMRAVREMALLEARRETRIVRFVARRALHGGPGVWAQAPRRLHGENDAPP